MRNRNDDWLQKKHNKTGVIPAVDHICICIDVKIVKYRLHVCDAIDASIPATLMRCLL